MNLFVPPPPLPLDDDVDHRDERELDDAMATTSLTGRHPLRWQEP